jgi:hypothetical protein
MPDVSRQSPRRALTEQLICLFWIRPRRDLRGGRELDKDRMGHPVFFYMLGPLMILFVGPFVVIARLIGRRGHERCKASTREASGKVRSNRLSIHGESGGVEHGLN